jgi:hypothetical protein
MPEIRDGLSGDGVSSDRMSDDEILDRTFERAARGGSPKQRSKPEAPRARGKHSEQHKADPFWSSGLERTTRRSADGRAMAKLSPAALEKFLGQEGSNSVQDNLVVTDPRAKPGERQRTAEEIRAEARARDPKAYDSAQERRAARQSEDVGLKVDSVLLRGMNIESAWEAGELDDDQRERLMFNVYRELHRVSPAALDELAKQIDDTYIESDDSWGDAEIESPEAYLASLPGAQLKRAVRDAEAHSQAVDRLVTSRAQIEGITQMNLRTFQDGLKELGVSEPADVESYERLTAYVQDATGISPGHLALTKPDDALDLMRSASAQMGHHARAAATREFHSSLLAEQDGSVQAGIVTGTDQSNAKMDQLIDTIREASGQEPSGQATPAFDPSWEPPVSAVEEFQTVGEFRDSLNEPEETSVAHGLTDGEGNSITLEEAARPVEAA